MANVLIVEDHVSFARLYAYYLDSAGHSTICANRGDEGISLYQAETPDLVIVDLSLPDMNGRDFISALQKLDPDVKIIALYFEPQDKFSLPKNVTTFAKKTRRPQFVELVNYVLGDADEPENSAPTPAQAAELLVTTSQRGTILISQQSTDDTNTQNCLEIFPEQVDRLVSWLSNSQRLIGEKGS